MDFTNAVRLLEDRYGSITVKTGENGAKVVEIAGILLTSDEAIELATAPITLKDIIERKKHVG